MWPSNGPILPVVFFSNFSIEARAILEAQELAQQAQQMQEDGGNSWGNPYFQTHPRSLPLQTACFLGGELLNF